MATRRKLFQKAIARVVRSGRNSDNLHKKIVSALKKAKYKLLKTWRSIGQ